jgi:hypothetical protein
MSDHKPSIEDRLQSHPHLRHRIEAILDIVEAPSGQVDTADEAEQRVTEELRRLGNDVLHHWAQDKEKQKAEELPSKGLKITPNGKKNSSGTRHTGK